jgi:hypothetical protein
MSKQQPPEKIGVEDVKAALRRSGYLIEGRIARALENRRPENRPYAVHPNWVYPDPTTGESRELDVFAEWQGPVSTLIGFLTHGLIIECVNNPQPLVLLTRGRGSSTAISELELLKWRTQAAFVPHASSDSPSARQPLSHLLDTSSYHHYFDVPYATQYCSFQYKQSKNPGEWMAVHEGTHFDSFVKLCDGVDERLAKWDQSRDDDPGFDEPVTLLTFLPVLVIQGELYAVDPTRPDVELTTASHLLYQHTRVVGNHRRAYRIDVVTEKGFASYLDRVERETRETASRLVANEPLIRVGGEEWVRRKRAERRARHPEPHVRSLS